jgi:hypothetical protein
VIAREVRVTLRRHALCRAATAGGHARLALLRRTVDLTAPATGLGAAVLDELLEPAQVALDAVANDAQRRPAFSVRFSGSYSICRCTRVVLSSRRWNVTTPDCFGPLTDRHATRSSGCCSVISASNSRVTPPIVVCQ